MSNLMKYLYLIIPAAFLLAITLVFILFHYKKKKAIRKTRAMHPNEKKALLDQLGEPAGYLYDPHQDLFLARHDAPQKVFGYTTFFDLSAPYFNMIFDYETFYFNYHDKTWLIEIWKGQYGINTGCELGVYYADSIIPADELNTTLFKAVQPRDMPDITLKLNKCSSDECRQYTNLGHVKDRHWWLTMFRMGTFSRPEELFVNISIRFRDTFMMYRFLDSFEHALPDTPYKTSGSTVYFTFYRSHQRYSFFKRLVRCTALFFCRFYCKWFRFVTRPFPSSGDKLLYLYNYLPFTVRMIFKKKKK